jgi:hypothetical protein
LIWLWYSRVWFSGGTIPSVEMLNSGGVEGLVALPNLASQTF